MCTQEPNPFNNQFNDFNEYLQPPPPINILRKKCSKDSIFDTVFFVNTASSILSFIMLCFLCVSGLVVYAYVSKTLVDAKDTLDDLNIILPEVHKTMIMLQHLCNTPEFKDYCYP
jgi:hypothetical protein